MGPPVVARATVSRTVKAMTPEPSLKRLSPAIFVSRLLETFVVLRIDRTATGSVGEIRAPKTSAHASG